MTDEVLNLGQLKILQEVITLSVFVSFVLIYMKEPFRLDFVWVGLCSLPQSHSLSI
ncbi:DMT family protein [Vibrio aestuarianus]|uniref:DMT family protein n=1 Tax=Vibrio aestuarianus TaxID=28171 RepID=UPI0030B915A3